MFEMEIETDAKWAEHVTRICFKFIRWSAIQMTLMTTDLTVTLPYEYPNHIVRFHILGTAMQTQILVCGRAMSWIPPQRAVVERVGRLWYQREVQCN